MSPAKGQILYILLTRPPLSSDRNQILVRLACMKHAASVRPEPGSNSPLSESYDSLFLLLKTVLSLIFSLRLRVAFVVLIILFELTSSMSHRISSSAILLSRCKKFRLTSIFAIYIIIIKKWF